jgi:hypothetical protein
MSVPPWSGLARAAVAYGLRLGRGTACPPSSPATVRPPLWPRPTLVGLAGPYDLAAVEPLAEPFVGVPDHRAVDDWSSADPTRRAAGRREVDVLLHGDADRTVSPAASREFAVTLRDGGHDVTLEVPPGVDHMGLVVAARSRDR